MPPFIPNSLRIVFMGTPEFSVPTLQKLIDSSHQVVAVYSQPPRPSGRGHKVQKSPVHLLAEAHGIPVFTPKSLRNPEEQEHFRSLRADVAVVIAYGLILPKPILEAPTWGCINIHASLLPRWRGAAPIHRAILAGDTQTGITIMCMDEGLDTGAMLAMEKIAITPETTTFPLLEWMAEHGANLLLPTLEAYIEGKILPVTQPTEGVTYAHKLLKEEGAIDWTKSAIDIDRQIRSFNPWPGTYFMHNGLVLKVIAAHLMEIPDGAVPGTVMGDDLTIACGTGALTITSIQKSGSKAMSALDFLRGYSLPSGTVLPCPAID